MEKKEGKAGFMGGIHGFKEKKRKVAPHFILAPKVE
jgi:hypothetical protein